MASLSVSNYLGMLQDDPHDESAYEGLREVVSSGDTERMGADAERLLEQARSLHETRGEFAAVAVLLGVESEMEADPAFKAILLKELGRVRREELTDDAGAKRAFEQVLEATPEDEDAEIALEEIEQAASRWREIADRFVAEAEAAADPELTASMYAKAASLVWQYKSGSKVAEVDSLFGDALKANPASTRAARLYAHVLRQRGKWKDLAKLLEATADAARDRGDKQQLYLDAARTFHRRDEDSKAASRCYGRVLEYSPGHEEALHFLVEFHTGNEDWDALIATYEDALRSRQKLESEQGILLQIGMVHWRIRNAPSEAEPYFARLRKIDPAHAGMLNFYREYLRDVAENSDEEAAQEARSRLVTVLGDAQRVAPDSEKIELTIEHAKAAQEANATERAIDAWKTVQRLDPTNEEAGRHLRELYEQGQKWNALVEVMRAELDALPAGSGDEEIKARRVERLRSLVRIYRDELELDVMVANTLTSLLEEDPQDEEALEQLASTYEKMSRWKDLIPVLDRQKELASDPEKKVSLLMRTASLWIERFANYNQATGPLEEVLEIAPEHRGALDKLHTIYTKKRAWQPLSEVLRRELHLASDPAARQTLRIELAQLLGDRVRDYSGATAAWLEALEEDPAAEGGLEALLRITEREQDWENHAKALEIAIEQADDDGQRVKLLSQLGTTTGKHLEDPARAATVWRRVLEIDPKNTKATRTLRDAYVGAQDWDALEALYAETGDWDGLADVVGNAAERTDDNDLRVLLSFKAASVYEDRIGNPERAFRSYERVLSVDPQNVEAATRLIPIYQNQEKWPRLLALHEVLIAALPDDDVEGRLAHYEELHRVTTTQTRDDNQAFRYATEAYRLAPNTTTQERLEETAESAKAYARLVDVYQQRLDSEQIDSSEEKALRRRLAALSGTALGKADEAILQLEQLFESDPSDEEAIHALDELYRQEGRSEDLRRLYVRRLQSLESEQDRVELLLELAPLEEDVLGDSESAAERYRNVLVADETNAEALRALDRLSTASEQWAELASVIEKRAELEDDVDARIAFELRLADVKHNRLEDSQGALLAYASVLESEATHPEAIAGLESLSKLEELQSEAGELLEAAYEAGADRSKLADTLAARLQRTENEDDRRALQFRLSDLHAELGDLSASYSFLEGAFLASPSDTHLWDRLSDSAEAAGLQERLAGAYSKALEEHDMPQGDTLELSRRVASIYDDVLGQRDAAEVHHQRILAEDPTNERAFESLKEFYTSEEKWEKLQKLYQNRIAETLDGEERMELLQQWCFILEEILDDVDGSISAYQEILEIDPDRSGARRSLERLYRRAERWPELAGLLRQNLADTEEDHRRTELLFEIAELNEHKIGDASVAVDEYERILELNPNHMNAQSGLERLLENESQAQRIAVILEPLYEAQGAYPELRRVLAVQLEEVQDPGGQVQFLTRMATLSESHLHEPEVAFETLGRAVLIDPADSEVRAEYGRLAPMVDGAETMATTLEAALEKSEGYTKPEILLQLGQVYDGLGNDEKSLKTYENLLEIDADNPDSVLPAAQALERIHLQSGDSEALARAYRLQIRNTLDDVERERLLADLGELLEREGDLEGAIEAQRRRVEVNPQSLVALSALESLYVQKERWPELIHVLQLRSEAVDDAGEEANLAVRIGDVYRQNIGDVDNAIVAYNDALERFGPNADVLSSLATLYEDGERWYDLREIRETQLNEASFEDAAMARLALAEIMREHTGEGEQAVELYREVLAEVPDSEGAISALESMMRGSERHLQVEAARTLVPYAENLGHHAKLIRALETCALSDDIIERLDSLSHAATIADSAHQSPGHAFDILARALPDAAGDDRLDSILDAVEDFALRSEKEADYVAILSDIAPEVYEAERQAEVYRCAAFLAESRLENRTEARALYRRVLDVNPDDFRALDALDGLQSTEEDWGALAQTLRRKLEIQNTTAERVTLLERLAELYTDKAPNVDEAVATREELLSEDDRRLESYEGFEALLVADERHDALASLYERWLDAGVGDPVELRFRLGRLCQQKLNDPHRALDQYQEALAQSPDHEASISAVESLLLEEDYRRRAAEVLEPVFLRRMEWPRVVSTLDARLSVEDDPFERREIHMRLGQIHEDYLEDLEGAFVRYSDAFLEDPTVSEPGDAVARLGRILEIDDDLADVYFRAIEQVGVTDERFASLAKSAGTTLSRKEEGFERGESLLSRVLDFDETDLDAFSGLRSVYEAQGRTDDLLVLLRRRYDVAESDGERLELLHEIARLHESTDDIDAALDVHREAMELAPEHPAAAVAAESLLTSAERWSDLADHLRGRIDSSVDPLRAELELRLGTLFEEKIEEPSRAVDVYEETVLRDPSNAASLSALETLVMNPELQERITLILEPIYRDSGEWKKLVTVLEARIRLLPAMDQGPLLAEVAELHEGRGQDAALAFHAWSRALAADPADEQASGEVDRLAGMLGAWDEQVASYEVAIENAQDQDAKSRLLAKVAEIHDGRRGDPRAAIETFERLAAHDPDNMDALDSLDGLHTMVGDWRGLNDVLLRKAERHFDGIERGSLFRRAASVAEELIGSPDEATKLYERATEENPDDAESLAALDTLHQNASRFEELAQVLERRFEVEQEDGLRADIGVRLGALYDTQLHKPNAAIDSLRRVTELAPDRLDALEALGTLYERGAQWHELLDNFSQRSGLTSDPAQQVAFVHRSGEIYERELDDVYESLERYRQALELNPRHEPSIAALGRIARLEDFRRPAFEILEPLFQVQERWDELATVYEARAEAASDPFEKKADYLKLATLHEEGRGNLEDTFAALKSAFGADPEDELTLENLDRVAAMSSRYDELAVELEQRATSGFDPVLSARLFKRKAVIAETHLGDVTMACAAYERALEFSPDDTATVIELERLSEAAESWPRLAELLERKSTMDVSDAERQDALVRLGALRKDRFDDAHGALRAFAEVAESAPSNERATAGLESLATNPMVAREALDVLEQAYRELGASDKVVGLYATRAQLAESTPERVRVLQEGARLWEDEIGDLRKASENLREAALLDPTDGALVDEFERVAAAGAPELLADFAAEAQSTHPDEDFYEVFMRSGRWQREILGNPQGELAAYESAIAARPREDEPRERLVELLRGHGGQEQMLRDALLAWNDASEDVYAKRERFFEAARISESALGDTESASGSYAAILELEPTDLEAIRELTRLREAEARWPEVATLLERHIELESDPTERLTLRRRFAHLHSGPIEDEAARTDAWERVLDESPEDLEAMENLEPIYEASERWDDLRRLIDTRLEIASTDQERIAARVRLARLAEKAFGRRAEARQQLRGVLEIDPQNKEALDELERLLRADEDWEELIVFLEDRAAAARETGDWDSQRDTLFEIAELNETQLGAPETAVEIHELILSVSEGYMPSLEAMVRLREGDDALLMDALERLARHSEPQPASQALQRVATLASDVGDADRSLAALRHAYELVPSATTLELLKAHYESTENWREYAALMEGQLAALAEAEQAPALKELADLYVEKLDDPAGAVPYLERASALAPDDRSVLLPLCDLYIAAGRQGDAIPVLRQIIESFAGRRSKELAQYHHRLGQALQGMGDADGALESFEAAFRIDLTNVAILRDLGRLTFERGDLARAQKAFRALQLQRFDASSGITKSDVYYHLGSIEHQQGNTRKAISVLERAVNEDPEHAEAAALLASLKS